MKRAKNVILVAVLLFLSLLALASGFVLRGRTDIDVSRISVPGDTAEDGGGITLTGLP